MASMPHISLSVSLFIQMFTSQQDPGHPDMMKDLHLDMTTTQPWSVNRDCIKITKLLKWNVNVIMQAGQIIGNLTL